MSRTKSEFGGGPMPKSTVHPSSRRALSAKERLRLMYLTGTDNPEADPDPAWFRGEQPDS